MGPSEDETQVIRFLSPLTIISGPNGSGKTTLIEALNYATTGSLPSGKLASFVHSVEACRKPRVDGMVKLQFTDTRGRVCVATKRVNATVSKLGKLQCKSDEFNIQITSKDGHVHSLSSKVADFQKEIVNLLGVPTAILDNVIFCHQEDSTWPLSEPKELKLRFDRIFRLTRFVKALDVMKKMKKDYEAQLATILEKQSLKEMVMKSKIKYVHQRDTCTALRNESKEKIRELDAKIKSCAEVIERSNTQLLEMEELERKAEVKRAELRMLNEQLAAIKVSPYPGSEKELRQEIQELDSSVELQQLETKRERLRANIDAISKDIARIVREKEEAESEMRKAISLKMIYGELENDVRSIQQEVDTAYGIHGPDYVGELHGKIAAEEDVLRNLKSAANAARETAQNRVDAAQMELTKWNCELSSASARIQQRKNEMEAEQRKLQKAQMSQNQIAELSQQISTVETSLSELPEMDNVRAEGLRSQRQVLQREVEDLRTRCLKAEKFNDIERDIERKKLQKDEQQQELDALMEKHSETLASAFGKVSKGPWSKAVNDMLKSMEQSNASLEKEVKICERDLDRASQALRQASINEEQLVNDVDSLRKKITELCGCTAQDVEDNLVETRLVLSKSRKELASLRTKATLYETWSEEVTKKSCCPLCERRFSSKAGAVELSGKLLDMSMSVPEEIERLERTVQEAEEKERRLVSAQNYVDQSRKIMDEKVKVARKEVGHYSKEEASLTTKLEELKEKHGKEATSYKRLLDVKADVSLMDSLFSSIRTLTEQLDELQERMDESEDNVPLSQMRRELVDKEENISSLNSELEEMQANFSERNRLTTKLHELRERRISLGEIAAQFEQIRRTVSQCRNEIDELTRRREEIMRHELPKAEEELRQAKGARDSAERPLKVKKK